MFPDSLCMLGSDSISSSTFWLAAGILFIAILAVFELVNKTKQETDSFNQNVNSRFARDNTDISAIFARLGALEKKCTECQTKCEEKKCEEKKPSPKKAKKVVEEPEEEEEETDEE
jgi:hypothetical protein